MAKRQEMMKLRVDELIDFDENPRAITEREIIKLKNSLVEFGYVNPITIDKKPRGSSAETSGRGPCSN